MRDRYERCTIKIEGGGYGIVMSTAENSIFKDRIGKPKIAICPQCGEVSSCAVVIKKWSPRMELHRLRASRVSAAQPLNTRYH